jgi:hypothetical protein
MPWASNSLITTVLGLTGIFLALAIFVQIVQEMYKHLTSSKGRAYTNALLDFLGPITRQLMRPGSVLDLRARGPFQLRRLRPQGLLLPLSKSTLVDGLERTLQPWAQRALVALRLEAEITSASTTPNNLAASAPPFCSNQWSAFLKELGEAEAGSPGYLGALEILRFLTQWNHSTDSARGSALGSIVPTQVVEAQAMLIAFRSEFLSHIEKVEKNYGQLMQNFDHLYERRNVRQTFLIALIVAVFFNLPVDRLWDAASKLSSEEAVTMAEQYTTMYERSLNDEREGTVEMNTLADSAQAVLTDALSAIKKTEQGRDTELTTIFTMEREWNLFSWAALLYFLHCLLTSLLISFGAPFWNDLASALLRVQKKKKLELGKELNDNA